MDVNEVLEQYLRCTINYQKDNWRSYLLLVEFAINNTIYVLTQQTPFYSNYNYHPRFDLLYLSKGGDLAIDELTT